MRIKITIIISIIFFFCIVAKSQQLKFGIIAGTDLGKMFMKKTSEIGFSSIENYSKPSYHINGILGFKSDSWWKISLEPGYIVRGSNLNFAYKKGSNIYSSVNGKLYSNFDLPILLDIDVNQKFYLSMGLAIDYTLSTLDDKKHLGVPIPNYEIFTNRDDEFSYFAILGLNYKLSDTYDVCIRYNLGLTKYAYINFIDDIYISVYNNCLQFSLKYNIN